MRNGLVRLFLFALMSYLVLAGEIQAQVAPPDLLVAVQRTAQDDQGLFIPDDAVLRYDGLTGSYVRAMTACDDMNLSITANPAIGPDGNLYVFDGVSRQLLRYDIFNGCLIDEFVPADTGGLYAAGVVLFGPDQNLYMIGSQLDGNQLAPAAILRYDGHTGAFLDVFGSACPVGVRCDIYAAAFGPDGNIYLAEGEAGSYSVRRINGTTGAFMGSFPLADVVVPIDLDFGPDGNIYVVSQLTSTIVRYTAGGAPLGVFARTSPSPVNLAFGPVDGNLYVIDRGGVSRYSGSTGEFVTVFAQLSESAYHLVFMKPGLFGCVLWGGTSSGGLLVKLKMPGGKAITTTTSLNGCFSFPGATASGKSSVTIDLPGQ